MGLYESLLPQFRDLPWDSFRYEEHIRAWNPFFAITHRTVHPLSYSFERGFEDSGLLAGFANIFEMLQTYLDSGYLGNGSGAQARTTPLRAMLVKVRNMQWEQDEDGERLLATLNQAVRIVRRAERIAQALQESDRRINAAKAGAAGSAAVKRTRLSPFERDVAKVAKVIGEASGRIAQASRIADLLKQVPADRAYTALHAQPEQRATSGASVLNTVPRILRKLEGPLNVGDRKLLESCEMWLPRKRSRSALLKLTGQAPGEQGA